MDVGLVYGCVSPHPPILVPAVAGPRVEQVRQTRDALMRVADDILRTAPDALVLVSPHAPINPYSMSACAAGRYSGSFDAFGAPSIRLSAPGDPDLLAALESECRALDVPLRRTGHGEGTHSLDHGATVPLFFLQSVGVRSALLLLSFSALDVDTHRRFGMAIAAAARTSGKRVVLIASGDLSHRLSPGAPAGFSPRGREFDEAIVSSLRGGDRNAILSMDGDLLYEAGECGYRSLVIALGALPEAGIEVLSYEAPFGVGYMVARFQVGDATRTALPQVAGILAAPGEELKADEVEALRLARMAVECYVREGRAPALPGRPEGLLAEKAGVFVSLKLEGQLRGCIGTFQPTQPNVAAEIIRNAISSACRDPRFLPVTAEELPRLQYSIDILSRPEPVEDMSQLDPSRYGVIVQSGSRRGLLLPDLEGVSTVEDQVAIARRKAGIPPGAPIQLQRFTVRRIREMGA